MAFVTVLISCGVILVFKYLFLTPHCFYDAKQLQTNVICRTYHDRSLDIDKGPLILAQKFLAALGV